MIQRWIRAFVLVCAFMIIASSHAAFLTSKHKPEYSRLNFNWESPVKYEMKQQGNLVAIKFKKARPITKAQIDAQLKSEFVVVRSFTTGKDFLEITFEMKKPAHALTLSKGGQVILDFIIDDKPDEKKTPDQKKDEPKKDELKKDVKPAADAKPEPAAADKAPVEELVEIKMEETVEGLKLVFDFKGDSKAGAFIEAGDLWLYFDRSVPFTWDVAVMNNSQLITDLVTYKSNNLSAVKIDLVTEPDKTSFYKKGHQWILETQDLQGIVPEYVEPKVADNTIIMTHASFGEPILAQMPETGHARYFIPSDSAPMRLEHKFRYVDCYMPVTILGSIIDPLSTGLSVEKQEQNIIVKKEGGLALSPVQDVTADRKRYQLPSLLNFKEWTSDAKDTAENKRDYQWDINSTLKQARTPKRLELVRHYLMTGRDYEALGLLTAALTYDPSLDRSPYFHSLRGLANFAAQRFDDARKSFENPALGGDPEMRMWEELAKCRDRAGQVNYDILAGGVHYFNGYPAFLKNTALLLAADAAVVQKKESSPFLEMLDEKQLTNAQKEHLEYLQAYRQVASDKLPEVMKKLENYSKTMQSEYRLKSSLLLLKLKADAKSITPEQEIEVLEKLRYHWSGDQNEYQVWTRLGDRYLDEEDYEQSLKFIRKAIRHFPKLATIDNLQKRGEDYFLKALADKEADLLELIGLFQEYDVFIPKDNRRFKIHEQMIDLLVKADMIDQAMDMLDQAIKDTAIDDAQKMRIRTRYGLLALLNDQPEKAMDVLKYQPEENLPGDLGDQRRFLMAQAYLMQNKFAEMRQLLSKDFTPAAFELVTQSYLDQKDWPNLASYIQNFLNEQKKSGAKIEPEAVLKLATAYGLQKRDGDLKKLRKEHLALMKESPYKDAFELITAENPTDFSSKGLAKELLKSQELTKSLESYREKVHKQGLSVF